ncbi:hypothetical protein JXO52_17365 [bacterium]|nr:hypothetical protein [bacterium]
MTSRWIRYIVAAILAISGATKLVDPGNTLIFIKSAGIIPLAAILPLLSLVTALELQLAVLIAANIHIRHTSIAVLLLFGAFFLISLAALVMDMRVDCGCFGPLSFADVGWPMVVRNGVFLLVCIYMIIKIQSFKKQ